MVYILIIIVAVMVIDEGKSNGYNKKKVIIIK
jgi:hypothetical protein